MGATSSRTNHLNNVFNNWYLYNALPTAKSVDFNKLYIIYYKQIISKLIAKK